MSALYGLVRFDGRPVEARELAAMRASLEAWGPDGGGQWREGCAGLGQLIANTTPEAHAEGGPAEIEGGRIRIAAAGRLDNRDELCAALAIPPARRASTPDGRLMASAYERWGEKAPHRLHGDWALAAWHSADRRLTLARDKLGATALYYHRSGPTFAFASSLKALFALPHVPQTLDELQLAQHLVPWPADGSLTWYEDVRRLPPAHVLNVGEGHTRAREYWHPKDAPAVRRGSDEAYAEEFAELFTRAVRSRLRTTHAIASTLSAGLDSTAVTGFAARELHRNDDSLTAFTFTPAHPEVAAAMPDGLVDEWPLASKVAAIHPNVAHEPISAADLTPLTAIRRSHEQHDEPEWGVGNLHSIASLLDQCARRGVGVLLTGQLGNGGVSWAGEEGRAFRLLTSGAPREALRALASRSHGPGGSWPLALRRELASPAKQRIAAERLRRRGPLGHPAVGQVIAPAFARRLDLAERIRASASDPSAPRMNPWEQRMAVLLPGITPVGAFAHQAGAAHRLELRDPTSDIRLLEFCLGAPPEQFVRGAWNRWLIRRGTQGVVPDEVRWNTKRGFQGADLAYRLRADEAAVTSELERIADSSLVRSYLDLDAIGAAWGEVRRDPAAPALLPGWQVARALNVGIFLRRFET